MSSGTWRMFAGDRPALLTAVVTTLLAVVVWVAVAVPGTAPLVQELDDSWRGLMAAREWAPFVVLAQVFALVGGVWVTVPLRIVVALWLWQRRRWTQFWVWVLAVVPAQAVTSLGKYLYNRPRPGDGLGQAMTASYPSGHATNAAVIALALVFILIPPGSRRTWLIMAVGYALVMAWTRTYLRMHWLSDVTGGFLWGTSCALWAARLEPRVMESRHSSTIESESTS